ncbi:MAG: AP2 domain-containing protein [Planctomycetota bacterium]
MHRAIIEAPYPLVVDHINHNGIDNRKANLRAVTQAQNILNRVHKKRPNSHSRYRGVSRHIRRNKWAVQICYNGRHKTVGYFQNEIEAAKAYDEAARKYHKEFAVLNFDE